jgi:hypothetical protein
MERLDQAVLQVQVLSQLLTLPIIEYLQQTELLQIQQLLKKT